MTETEKRDRARDRQTETEREQTETEREQTDRERFRRKAGKEMALRVHETVKEQREKVTSQTRHTITTIAIYFIHPTENKMRRATSYTKARPKIDL